MDSVQHACEDKKPTEDETRTNVPGTRSHRTHATEEGAWGAAAGEGQGADGAFRGAAEVRGRVDSNTASCKPSRAEKRN